MRPAQSIIRSRRGIIVTSPPEPVRIGRRAGNPGGDLRGEHVKRHMAVGKEHILPPLRTALVPPSPRVADVETAVFPLPVALDNLIDRTARDFIGSDGGAGVGAGIVGFSRDVAGAPRVNLVLGAVAVAVFYETVLRAIIGVAPIRRAAPGLARRNISVEGPVGVIDIDTEAIRHR